MTKQKKKKDPILTQFVEHEDTYQSNAMQRYQHENLKQPTLTFKDRRG